MQIAAPREPTKKYNEVLNMGIYKNGTRRAEAGITTLTIASRDADSREHIGTNKALAEDSLTARRG